jgi:hypothetical protein
MGQGAEPQNPRLKFRYEIGAFLNSVKKVGNLAFSGLVNPVLNKVVDATVLMSDGLGYNGNSGTYGSFVDLQGQALLQHGSTIDLIADSYGVLIIDGVVVATAGPTGGTIFTGKSGVHNVEIKYWESDGGTAFLICNEMP